MKIAIMGRWNATCGISLHAELIGRRLNKMGHEVIVFAPSLESANRDWHHKPIDTRDEPWVYRVYNETEEYNYPYGGWIKVDALLEEDYDALIVEGYHRFPIMEFSKVASRIKRRATLILVVHVGYLRDLIPYMSIDWDAIVVFDKRYVKELIAPCKASVLSRTYIIPYPHAIVDDDIMPFRPAFAKDKILFITYGRQPLQEYYDYIHALRRISERYDIAYWIIRSDHELPLKDKWIVQWVMRPDIMTLYSFVMGSDIHLLPKSETGAVVVSSTVAQILYSGVPIIAPDTRYFETIPVDERGYGPIVKYRLGDVLDLEKKIVELIEDDELRKTVSENARRFARKYSDGNVARMFEKLIEALAYEEKSALEYLNPLREDALAWAY